MKFAQCLLFDFLKVSLFCALMSMSLMNAQQPASSPSSSTVPRLVNFSGKVADVQGKTITGIAGVTFAIYKDPYDGAPLWHNAAGFGRGFKVKLPSGQGF